MPKIIHFDPPKFWGWLRHCIRDDQKRRYLTTERGNNCKWNALLTMTPMAMPSEEQG